jgi:hypothetical protein
VNELEQRLTKLGRELEWPETPELAPRVAARLDRPAPRRHRPKLFGRTFAIALASLLVLAGGVFAAVPGVRDAVLEFFGLQGATVERRPELPAAPELRPLRLGERTTLERASRTVGFEPLVPVEAGRPDAVFVNQDVPGGELSLAYRARRGLPEARSTGLGLLVGQFRGDLAPDYIGKIAGETTRIDRLRVGGNRAIWIEGAPHLFFYRPPNSDFAERELRIAENVLLVERGDLLVRLEGSFGSERAVELALSLE